MVACHGGSQWNHFLKPISIATKHGPRLSLNNKEEHALADNLIKAAKVR